MEFNKTKKVLMIISLSTLALSCLMLILAIFKVKIFEGVPLRILLISSAIAISCAVSITEINIIKQKKVLGLVSLSLLMLSVLFALIIFCSPLLNNANAFNRLTGILSIFSILFMIIISLNTKLEKKFFALQIITYIFVCVIDIMLSLLIAGVDLFNITAMTEIFWILIVVSVGLLITLSVLSSKKNVENINKHNDNNETITITKTEYDALLKENAELKEKIKTLTNK